MSDELPRDSEGSLDIAIVGMACRFPGASDVDAFWRNLRDGVESIRFFTDEELAGLGVPRELSRKEGYVKAGAVLDQIDRFDGAFFGYSPREAELLDPQHRLFLECAWEALERAGFDHEGPRSVGVFAGTSMSTYLLYNLLPNPEVLEANDSFQLMISNDKDFLATRVSYNLDLRGPSLDIQTGCSTSLVATHLACQSLLGYQCDVALAGGVSIHMPQKTGYLYQPGGISSPDGHCRAFDADAKGTLFGSGVGVVVLKRLADALADGDHIHAVIKGSAINNDGASKLGYTAPSIEGQVEVIARAQLVADVTPESIQYVEAHGTGTALGDPVEVSALTQVFRAGTEATGFCAIGSVKSNIGHCDAAAGVAGLIKTASALEHGEIPPTLHCRTPNPNIDWASSPFHVASQLREWRRDRGPRRAGVSSFGIGGTNAHAILEEAPPPPESGPSRPWQLLLLSARTETALEQAARRLAEHLERHPGLPLADVAHTLRVGRKSFPHRKAFVCRDREDALALLGGGQPERMHAGLAEGQSRSVVFMFPGGGAQYLRMGQELYEAEPAFRESFDRCADILARRAGIPLREVVYPREERAEDGERKLTRTATALPALFAVEYSLARLWMSWGLQPAAMVGHSMGEYVAACLAGVLSLEDALALVAERGRLFELLPRGAMLSVALPEEEVRPLLGTNLSLAAVNGPRQCVVAGDGAAIDALASLLAAKDVEHRRVHIDVAAHSHLIDPIMPAFAAFLRKLELRAPGIPFISGVSGTWITEAEATRHDYWVQHLRQTVRFGEGIRTLLAEPGHVFLEVGPGRTLSSLARLNGDMEAPPTVLASMRAPRESQSDVQFLLDALGRLWLAGVRIEWHRFTEGEKRRRVVLPTYPFERKRSWVDPLPEAAEGARAQRLGKKPDLADWFYLPSWKRTLAPRPAAPAPRRWLIFADAHGLGTRLAQRLATVGHEVTTVTPGEEFRRVDGGAYEVDPRRRETYAALFGALEREGRLPERIVHLWSVADPGDDVERAQELGFLSLLYLGQGLGTVPAASSRHLLVVSSGVHAVTGREALRPERATIEGPCRVLPKESAGTTCLSVDVDLPASGEIEPLVTRLLAEATGPAVNGTVAWRGPHRYERALEPVRLEPPAEATPRLRQRGVYLITGGLGGLGLVLATHLARVAQARLALIGRSRLPARETWDDWRATRGEGDPVSRKLEQLRCLEALGAEVLVLDADVADPEQMRAALQRVREAFGEPNGVLHAAGVPAGGLIQFKTPEMVARIFRPKIQGTLVLDRLLGSTPLDFFLLFSSRTAVVGDFGQVDHCAANAFLDAFAQRRAAEGRPFTALAWDTWREVGQAVTTELSGGLERFRDALLAHGITPAEGLQVLDRVLAELPPHVVVSTQSIAAVLAQGDFITRQLTALGEADAPTSGDGRAVAPFAAPGDEVERRLAEIWQRLLGVPRVGLHDSFFDLGGNSLIGLKVVAEIKRALGVELPVVSLFERPTINAFARLITRSPEETASIADRRSRGARRLERLRQKLGTE